MYLFLFFIHEFNSRVMLYEWCYIPLFHWDDPDTVRGPLVYSNWCISLMLYTIFLFYKWCRGVRARWCWAVRLHIDDAELPGVGRSAQDWQEIVIWPNWGNFWVRCSILAITLATSIRFVHMIPIRKALFGAHIVAIEICLVNLISSPKIHYFPFQNPNFRYFFHFR
jgi:hypothetical protein